MYIIVEVILCENYIGDMLYNRMKGIWIDLFAHRFGNTII